MSKNKKIPITAGELENILGRSIKDYESMRCFPKDVTEISPSKALKKIIDGGIKKELKDLQQVKDGFYRSGDIWKGTANAIWLYLGKALNGKKDALVNLGGDRFNPGDIYLTTIDTPNYEFISQIFPPI